MPSERWVRGKLSTRPLESWSPRAMTRTRGIALSSSSTAVRMPSKCEMRRNGRRTRKMRNVRNVGDDESSELITIKPSSRFQPEARYDRGEKARPLETT